MQNNKSVSVFSKLSMKLEICTPIIDAFYVPTLTLVTDHSVITITQSIPGIFFLPFVGTNRKLCHTFGFNKFLSCDVTISGKDSRLLRKLATTLTNIRTNFQLDSYRGTMLFYRK